MEQGTPRGLYGPHDLFIHLEDSQRMCGWIIPLCFKAQWNDLVVGTSGCLELSKQWSENVPEVQDSILFYRKYGKPFQWACIKLEIWFLWTLWKHTVYGLYMILMVFNILFRERNANINLFNNKTTDFHVILFRVFFLFVFLFLPCYFGRSNLTSFYTLIPLCAFFNCHFLQYPLWAKQLYTMLLVILLVINICSTIPSITIHLYL